MDIAEFPSHAKHRAWFVVLQALLALLGVVVVLAARNETTYTRTTHLALHPDGDVAQEDVPLAIDALRADGPLVQTALQLLESDDVLEQTMNVARVDATDVAVSAAVHPGSAYFDVSVRGSDEQAVARVADDLGRVASASIGATFAGYALDGFGTRASADSTYPPSVATIVMSLALGALVGLAFVFVEWCFLAWRGTTRGSEPVPRLSASVGVPAVSMRAFVDTGRPDSADEGTRAGP